MPFASQDQVGSPVVPSQSSLPGAMDPADAIEKARALSRDELQMGLRSVFEGHDLSSVDKKVARQSLAKHFNLAPEGLDERKAEIRDLQQALVQESCDALPKEDDLAEDLGEESASKVKQTYLVTFSHPQQEKAENGVLLKPPSSYSTAL